MKVAKVSTGGRAGGPRLSRVQIAAYSLAVWPLVVGQMPLNFVVPYYTQILGLNLGLVGLLLMCGRIFDGFADMTIAYVSDTVPTRFGRRKPWVIVGISLFIPAVWLLFVPSPGMSMTRYGVGIFLFFITWTMAFIPYLSQGTELSTDHHERSVINIVQSVVMLFGLLFGYVAPFLLVDKRTFFMRRALGDWLARHWPHAFQALVKALHVAPAAGVASYGRTMLVVVIATTIVGPLVLAGYAWLVPDRSGAVGPSKGAMTSAFRNPVFQRFCIGLVLIMAGYLGRTGLFAFLLSFWFHRADMLLLLIMTQIATSILVTPLWSMLFTRLERKTCIALAALLECVALILLVFAPRDSGAILVLAFVIIGLPGQTLVMAPYLVAADCADYSQWKNRTESRAVHVSIVSVIVKLGNVFAASSVVLASVLGFNPRIVVQPQSIIDMLKIIGLFIPIVCLMAGAAIVMTYPITRRRQAAIQRRLDRRLVFALPSATAGAFASAPELEAGFIEHALAERPRPGS